MIPQVVPLQRLLREDGNRSNGVTINALGQREQFGGLLPSDRFAGGRAKGSLVNATSARLGSGKAAHLVAAEKRDRGGADRELLAARHPCLFRLLARLSGDGRAIP